MANRKKLETRFVERFIFDLKKPDIDKHERAEVISEYMREQGLSQRGFGLRFNIPKSTVEDWLIYKKLTKNQYGSMLKKGMSEMSIYRLLRENKNIDFEHLKNVTNFDLHMRKMIREIKSNINSEITRRTNISSHTISILKDLSSLCNTLMFKIERDSK